MAALKNDASNIIQVNGTELYVIGGNSDLPSLVARKVDVPTSCFKIDVKTGQMM